MVWREVTWREVTWREVMIFISVLEGKLMFQKKAETIRLQNRMEAGFQGDVITVPEMEALLKMPANGSKDVGYRVFNSVSRTVEFQTGGLLCWRWLRSEGRYRVLRNNEMPQEVQHGTKLVRRRCLRNVRIGNAVEMEKLTNEQQRSHQVHCVLNGAIVAMLQPRRVQQIIHETPLPVPPTPADIMAMVKSRQVTG